jgi:hypothetical protein
MAEAREKTSTGLESLEFLNLLYLSLTKIKNNQILPNRISNQFLVTSKLFIGEPYIRLILYKDW